MGLDRLGALVESYSTQTIDVSVEGTYKLSTEVPRESLFIRLNEETGNIELYLPNTELGKVYGIVASPTPSQQYTAMAGTFATPFLINGTTNSASDLQWEIDAEGIDSCFYDVVILEETTVDDPDAIDFSSSSPNGGVWTGTTIGDVPYLDITVISVEQ